MYSHMMVGSNDLDRSKTFYDALFGAVGGQPGIVDPKGRLVYMHDGGVFLVTKPIDGEAATPARQVLPSHDAQHAGHEPQRQRRDAAPAARGPGLGHRRDRGQHHREPAQGDKAHDTDVEEPREPPLQVDPKRHDRAHQPHVQDDQRRVPALQHTGRDDERRDEREETERPHTDFPLKRPVGRNSSTMIRITKLTANL